MIKSSSGKRLVTIRLDASQFDIIDRMARGRFLPCLVPLL